MTDLSKIKIPFSLALLAALFTIHPLIDKYGKISYALFNLSVSINFIYIIFFLLLGASVYFYAIGLVGEKPIFESANKVGHITYALALIVPPFFVLLYLVSLLSAFLINIWYSPTFSKVVEYALSALIGVAASIISSLIVKTFAQRDKKVKVDIMTEQENHLLARAKQLFQQGYFDLAVSESWKAIEVSLSKAFFSIGEKRRPKTIHSLLELARQREILTDTQVKELMQIRRMRNEAIHTDKRVASDEALTSINLSEKIIASLEKSGDQCYFCGRFFPFNQLETDNITTGASVCQECARKNQNWQEDLAAMGMDP